MTGKKRHEPHFNDGVREYLFQGGNDAEALGGLSELALHLERFLHRFSHFFVTRQSCVFLQAVAFAQGLLLAAKRNIERIEEQIQEMDFQSLYHFLSQSPWDDRPLCNQVAVEADRLLGGTAQTCLIIDPTGIPKKGDCSVGVARQWLGCQGKVDNGQLGVAAALARGRDVCLIDKELYLPHAWTEDPQRCERAKIPKENRGYRSTAEIARDLIQRADHNGVRYAWIGMDCEFGKARWLLEELDAQDKVYLADIAKNTLVYAVHPRLRFKRRKKNKRKSGKACRSLTKPKPLKVEKLVGRTDARKWRSMVIRNTTTGPLKVEILHLQVWLLDANKRPRRHHLLVRRDRTEKQTRLKYTLSNAPLKSSTQELAYRQAQRFWVEHSIKEHKQQLGLGQYQVRLWRAWHHHFALVMLLDLFLLEMRLLFQHDIPMLSAEDIRYLLRLLLYTVTFQQALDHIRVRHVKRAAKLVRYHQRE